jgi:hypothetical protein
VPTGLRLLGLSVTVGGGDDETRLGDFVGLEVAIVGTGSALDGDEVRMVVVGVNVVMNVGERVVGALVASGLHDEDLHQSERAQNSPSFRLRSQVNDASSMRNATFESH